MTSSEELFDLFAFDADTQKWFHYTRQYQRRINKRRKQIVADRAMMRRYMLAGMHVDYRAANHSGDGLSTRHAANTPEWPAAYRLYLYREFTGEEIEDTGDYLGKIGMHGWRLLLLVLRIWSVNHFLYRFVVYG